MFLDKLQNTGVAEGYPVRLECRVLGSPPPQIFWKKENDSLTYNTDRVRYLFSLYVMSDFTRFGIKVLFGI